MNNFLPVKKPSAEKRLALKIAGIYLLVSSLWILITDWLLAVLIGQPAMFITSLQTVKGWMYVTTTAIVLYLLIYRSVRAVQHSETLLHKSEAKNQAFINAIPDLILLLNADGVIIDYKVARDFKKYLSSAKLLGEKITGLLLPEERAQALNLVEQARQTGEIQIFEFRLPLVDHHRHYEARLVAIEANEVLAIVRDITQLRHTEVELGRVNRALTVLSEVNQALLRATIETDLLADVCRIIVEIGGYRLAWVGLADQDEARQVRPVAQAGYEAGYLETVNVTWADTTERGSGLAGQTIPDGDRTGGRSAIPNGDRTGGQSAIPDGDRTGGRIAIPNGDRTGGQSAIPDGMRSAIHTGQPYVVRNILTDPTWASWRTEASQHGYTSVIALPLMFDNRALGVLNMYAAEADAFDTEEVKLLTELANDVAFGLSALRTRAEHQRIEKALILEEMRLNSLLELSQKVPDLNEEDIVRLALNEAVKLTHSAIGYLHLVNPDQGTIQLVTWSQGTLEVGPAEYESHYPLDKAGVWADCARTKKPVVHNDYQPWPNKKGYPPGHVPLTRHLSVPILDNEKVVLIMGVGNKEQNYDDTDVRQMLLTADHLWKIIRRKRAERELRHYRNHLEELVVARTAELTLVNEQLHREISERKHAEAALRENEVRFRTIADFTYDWEYWLGPNGNFIYVSPSCERITGYKPDEFQNEPELMRAIIHPDDQERCFEHFGGEVEGDVTTIDFRIITRDGQHRWIGHVCQPVYSLEGQWLGRRASNRDITERKQLQTQLQDYAQHLEQLVAVKVQELELERAKTIQAAKMVALGEMATGVAHELNQPLTAMLLDADYLKTLSQQLKGGLSAPTQPNPQELYQIGENLGRDIARCRRIIDHLRAFGRVSSNYASSVNLNQPIQESFVLIGERLINHGIVVHVDLSPQLPFILADTHKLEQVFLNLINNAEHALQEMDQRVRSGKIDKPDYQMMLKISTYAKGGTVFAMVSDNGCGIPSADREHLFEPFFTTKPLGRGTGLGLSISYSIIQEFKGEISFDSVENEGTTFLLCFPVLNHQANPT